MKRLTTRGALLGGAAVMVAVMVPQAGASLGGQSAPIGISVYASVDSDLCGSSYKEDNGSALYVDVCAGRKLNIRTNGDAVPALGNALGYPVFVYVTHCVPSDGCDSNSYEGNVTASQYTIDPLLGSGSVHANIDGCQVDLDVTAADLPEQGGNLYRSVSPNGEVRLELQADEGLSRQATSAGSVCGQSFTGGTGALAHAVNATLSVNAGTTS